LHVVDKQLSVKGITVVRKLDEGLPPATVDANQMQQVFMNLLVNAADAIGDRDGSIMICSRVLHLAPQGVAQIRKAVCRKGHDMINAEVKIDSFPSIRVKTRVEGEEGIVDIDPVYGKNRHRYGLSVPVGAEVEMLCPECNASLRDTETRCPLCAAPTYAFEVPPHGLFQGCSRRGCGWQRWEAIDAGGDQTYIEVSVSDTGPGIPEEEMDKIFDPFYSTKGQRGTGLGLAVIWGIVDNHKGTIRVESEVGRGTTFVIRLPNDQLR
jgi:signal transduction histidine kinase